MAMLARTAPRRDSLRAPVALAAVAIVENCVEARIAGTMVVALPEGALWIESGRALVVADLHLEKGSAFARGGQMLPPYDTAVTLARLAALIEAHKPDIVVSLGDAFHDGGGPQRMHEHDRAQLGQLTRRCDWIWIEGNHDGKAAETLGGAARDRLFLGPLVLRHEPSGASGEVAGHLHPCVKVTGGGASVRRRCFAYDGASMVLPAFGAFTGGLNVRDPAFAPIFPRGVTALALGKNRVLPISPLRQTCD
jgi:uncharacterized protein